VSFREVEEWVRANLPPPPARVLEIGAGDGSLARALRADGWEVTAIDPRSESPDVEPVALGDLPAPERPFDAAVAVVSLHHVEPLEASVERLADVLPPGAPLLLDEYFAGRRRAFDLPLDLRVAPFHEQVLRELALVPYGQVDTYGHLAARVGRPKAARAVGTVMNRNPLAIVLPCHRIVGANGSLTGYAGGLDVKRALLALEGATLAV